MNEKISVIIPCYNAEKYLEKCLDSVVNQTYKNLEIICVNDGSTDNTLKIIENYSNIDKRIKVINQENLGASQARNNALKLITGNYVAFVDCDDWVDTTVFEKAVAKIEEYNCDLVFWSYNKCYGDNILKNPIYGTESRMLQNSDYFDFYRTLFGLSGEQLNHPELADSLCTIWGKLYKKELLHGVEFVDLKEIGTFEDGLFNIQCLINGKSAYYLAECMYNYRKTNSTSITTKYKANLFEKWQNLFSIIDNFIKDNKLEQSFKFALNNRIALSIIGLGLNELSNPKGANSQVKNISKIIHSEKYKKAYKNLTLKYFPIHWKIFFFFAKHRCSLGLFVLLKVINMLRGKIR